MRSARGKLITVWEPGNQGAGGSTITNAVAIALQHRTRRKTLIVNWGSRKNYLEQYMKNDIDFKYTLDYLKSFDMELHPEHVDIFASPINEVLSILPGCKLYPEITKTAEGFERRFLESALTAFELVVIDMGSGAKDAALFLDNADMILAVMGENRLELEDICDNLPETKGWVHSDRTIGIFNGVHTRDNEAKLIKEAKNKLGLKETYCIHYDVQVKKAASYDNNFYCYMKKNLDKSKVDNEFVGQATALAEMIIDTLFLPAVTPERNLGFLHSIFGSRRHWGEIDA